MSRKSALFEPMRTGAFRGLIASHVTSVFNDNLFKQAFVLAMAFASGNGAAAAMAMALYTAPFFLCAPIAGACADRFDKARAYRALKLAEVGLMGAATAGFLLGSTPFLFATLSLMGAQSAFLGPLRQGLMTERLAADRWTGGNALLSAATFLSILAGMGAAGAVADLASPGVVAGVIALVTALGGWTAARGLKPQGPADPARRIDPNVASGLLKLVRTVAVDPALRRPAALIAWFWGLAALAMSAFPMWVQGALGGAEATATALMALFAVGVGLGAMASQILGRGRPSEAVTAAGAALICLSACALAFLRAEALTVEDLLQTGEGLVVTGLTVAIALGGGLFITPLQTRLQLAAPNERRGEVFAASGAVNAIASTVSAGVVAALSASGAPVGSAFLIIAVLNLPVAALIVRRALADRRQGAPAVLSSTTSASASCGSR